jgi:hypothetical protein
METQSSLSTTQTQSSVKNGATTTPGTGYRLPDNTTLQHAAKLSIVEDKPIMLDYWTFSLDKSAIIGVKDTSEKLLVKSEEEYTSPIHKIYKVAGEYIIITENSIYIVDVNIPTKRISAASDKTD